MEKNAENPRKTLFGRVCDGFGALVAMIGPVATGILALILVVVLFYQEEDWRGKRAWERALAKDAAAGKIVDWPREIPPTVDDDENFFKAPDMAEWFGKSGGMNMLVSKLDYRNFAKSLEQRDMVVASVTFVSPGTLVDPRGADLVLRYEDSMLTVFDGSPSVTNAPQEIIPVIEMKDVPLTDAIKHLAKAANVNYRLDPTLNYGRPDASGYIHSQPTVSFRWTNLTGLTALKAVLANYNLRMMPGPATGIVRIVVRDPAVPVDMNRELTARLSGLIQQAVAPLTNAAGERITGMFSFVNADLSGDMTKGDWVWLWDKKS